ncbi:MAG: hypothetical protein ACREQ9_13415 [Candidatus Binatia bacterium]
MRRFAIALTCFALGAVWCLAAAKEPTPLPEGRERSFTKQEEERALTIQRQFQDAGRALAETHAAALRKPELERPLESLRRAMETEMIRRAPEKKDQILRRYAVHREMRVLEKNEQPTALDKERYQALLLEFTNLSEGLGELPDEAAKAPALAKEREKFHKALVEVMTKIDPKTPEHMKQQQKSAADYTEFSQELMSKQTAPKPLAPEGAAAAAATPAATAPK